MKRLVKNSIAKSFVKLCSEKPICKITINNIIDYCEISKQTFYNYFMDKQDLMNYVYQIEVEDAISKYIKSNNDSKQIAIWVCEACLHNADYYKTISNFNTQNNFTDFFYQYTKEFYISAIIESHGEETLTPSIKRAIEFHCAGAEKLFIDWIKKGMIESPEELTNEIIECMPLPLKQLVFSGKAIPPNIVEIQKEMEMEATLEFDKLLNSLMEKYKDSGLILKKEIVNGLVDIEIEEFAKDNHIDLIVMGRRGFSPAKRFFVGSTTRKMVATAPCSVMVVKE